MSTSPQSVAAPPPPASAIRWLRRRLRTSEPWFIALALLAGMLAGALAVLQGSIAHRLQANLFALAPHGRLSTVADIPVSRLLVLPLGGLVLGLFGLAVRVRRRALVDAVEANALHGGRMSARDSLIVSMQTLLSNGSGASVGLEAGYVQAGSGVASLLGRRLQVRRSDLRTLVGAGTGAAIAAAFGAPLTGAFYAFEIVIGAYTPAALAPVAAACLGAVAVARGLGGRPYVMRLHPSPEVSPSAYFLYLVLAILCAGLGIAIMRLVALVERRVAASGLPHALRPAVGGLLLIPLAAWTPQVLSSGHGALSSDLVAGLSVGMIALLFGAKCLASVVSLGFGFRGGLFFASLFLGTLAGHLFAEAISAIAGQRLLDNVDTGIVGMAALAVSIIGGPLSISMLVLEVTHDFALTSAAMAGALVCSTLVRTTFGYSFSTWRLHLRGHAVKSARDVGWMRHLTAADMMRRGPATAPAAMPVERFRREFPLGSASRVVLLDEAGHYAGIALPVAVHDSKAAGDAAVSTLAVQDRAVPPEADVVALLSRFDSMQADELVVVDADGDVLGLLSETYVRRRYAEELENHQRELFGER